MNRVLRSRGNLQYLENQGIKFEVKETGKLREFFHILTVFAPFSVHIPSNFLGPSKTAVKMWNSQESFGKLSLENLDKSGNFY